MAESLIAQHKTKILPDDHPAMIQLSAVTNEMCSRSGIPKRKLVIIADHKPNAFVVGGQYIFLFTGLSKALPMVDQIAFVLGHEIGHTLAGHWGDGMVRRGMVTAAAILLAFVGGNAQITSQVSKMFMVLPKSRSNEKEADIIG